MFRDTINIYVNEYHSSYTKTKQGGVWERIS